MRHEHQGLQSTLEATEGGGSEPRLRNDVVTAVRAAFPASEVDDVLVLLNRVDSDRVAVAILVGAPLETPDILKIRQGVELSFVDYAMCS
jgi:hypothetical protein